MQVPFYGHVRQYHNLKQELDEAILGVLESGQFVMGPAVKKFEKEFAAYMGTKHAVGLNSGTDALWLAFLALGIKPGDEIITVTNTFFATAEAAWIVDAKVVFVDSDPVTRNIDPNLIEAAITPRTKAIVPVHLYGLCADMNAISKIAKKHNLFVIEDAAQSIDASGPGFKQGELSDVFCTSFIIQKNLGTFGDGGAIATNNDHVAAEVLRLRNHGSTKRSVHTFGFNSRLDDLHAAILSVKLKHITEWTDRRRAIAARYTAALKDTCLTLPVEPEGYRHAMHLYVVEHAERNNLEKFLIEKGIDAKLHYPIAIHEQEGFPWGKQAKLNPVPNSERNAATCLSLPMFPELTDAEIDYTIEQLLAWDKDHK